MRGVAPRNAVKQVHPTLGAEAGGRSLGLLFGSGRPPRIVVHTFSSERDLAILLVAATATAAIVVAPPQPP
jgi:hypothetical protein